MRPGGSRTTRIEPSGSTLAPATAGRWGNSGSKRFDDHVALADQTVHLEGVPSRGVGEDHQGPTGFHARAHSEGFGQQLDRDGLSVHADDAAPFGMSGLRGSMGLRKHHPMEGQRKALAAGIDEKAAQDGCGDRDDDPELGAGAGLGSHLDPAMGRFDIGPDNVEADTSSGHVSDERGGGQAGFQGQPEEFLGRHPVGVDTASRRLLSHAVHIDAPAVIGHRDDHVRAQLHGVQPDGGLRGFAGPFPLVGEFDAMVDRIADQMHQRVGELVQHASIQFGVDSLCLPPDVLAQGPRQVADGPLELIGDRGNGNHLGSHRPILQVVQQPGLLVELGAGCGVDLEPVLEHASDTQMGRGRLTDQAGEFLQSLERNHDDRARTRLGRPAVGRCGDKGSDVTRC